MKRHAQGTGKGPGKDSQVRGGVSKGPEAGMNEGCQSGGHRGEHSWRLESANPGSKPLFATCSVSLFLYFLGPQFNSFEK